MADQASTNAYLQAATKPPIPYYGGKTRLAPWIVGMLPLHKIYVEPFAGSLAVLLAKPRSKVEIVNDLDGWLVTFWRVLRDRGDELERACALTPYARDEYAAALDEDLDDLERARLFWAWITMSFNAVPGHSGWRVSTAQNGDVVTTQLTQLRRFAAVAARLRSVAIENRPAVDLVRSLAKTDALIYADPPYVHDTRTDGGSRYTAYRHEMTNDDHRELAAALHDHPGPVLLSGYASELYAELYDGWWTMGRQQRKWSASTDGSTITRETLWSNRDLTQELRLDFAPAYSAPSLRTVSTMVELDPGIARAVGILQDAGVHTYESCEGGPGHTYQDPTIRFYGSPGEGWRALAICMDHGLPVMHLQRSWDHDDGDPSGPYWQIVLRPSAHAGAGLAPPVTARSRGAVGRRDLTARRTVRMVVIDVWVRRIGRVVCRHLRHVVPSLNSGADPSGPPSPAGPYANHGARSTPHVNAPSPRDGDT